MTKYMRNVYVAIAVVWHLQLDVYCRHFIIMQTHNSYTVWVKKVAPLKLSAVFSLLVKLCNWNLPGLLPKHIPMSTPLLVHLSEYLCEMYHFYRCAPQILRIQFNLLRNHEFFVKAKVTSNDIQLNITISICYTNCHITYSKFPLLADTNACIQLRLSFIFEVG